MNRVGITGHQGAPDSVWAYALPRLTKILEGSMPGLIGISSLAAGADQFFANLVVSLGGDLEAVIPSENYDQTFDSEHLETYRKLIGAAKRSIALPFQSPTESAFMAAGKRVVDEADLLIAIWDGEDSHGYGGTADVVRYAQANGKRVVTLWPEGVSR